MSASYLDKYFECVEFMPLELQRCVSQLREIDNQTQGLYEKIECLRCDLVRAVEAGDGPLQRATFRRLQECVLEARETGNTKLEISSQLLDVAEGCTQLLDLRGKEVESLKSDELYTNSRYHPSSTANNRAKADSPSSFVTNGAHENKPTKRNTASKRPRQTASSAVAVTDKSVDDVTQEKGVAKESGRGRENSVSSNVSNGGTNGSGGGAGPNQGGGGATNGGGGGGGKPPKKKVKTVKKKAVVSKEKDSAPAPITPSVQVPMPDLTSQPLDPNEPTYCLCQQVSFGEMIGCDNDDCPIEWFHFQCVNLTSKPKGKWYCPRCAQERKRTSK